MKFRTNQHTEQHLKPAYAEPRRLAGASQQEILSKNRKLKLSLLSEEGNAVDFGYL